jgi:predicted DNA-binding protein (UPF0251 family)
MSPRLKTIRKILNPPLIKGFKPYGSQSPTKDSVPVILLFEEYESLRLCDYDHYNHHESSVMMGVSRPTFTRIYASALRKIAIAFVEGRQISIEGGKIIRCPLCGDQNIITYDLIMDGETGVHQDGNCICPGCGYQVEHQPGNPCNLVICPQCKSSMRRRRKINL